MKDPGKSTQMIKSTPRIVNEDLAGGGDYLMKEYKEKNFGLENERLTG